MKKNINAIVTLKKPSVEPSLSNSEMSSSTPLTTHIISISCQIKAPLQESVIPTAVDDPHVSPKRLAGEIRHVAHVIAEIPSGKQPMEHRRPDGDPGHEARVQRDIVPLYDVEDGVVEQGNQTRDTDDSQRLGAEGAKDDARQCRGEERFVDAVEAVGTAVHVEDEGQCWQDAVNRKCINIHSI